MRFPWLIVTIIVMLLITMSSEIGAVTGDHSKFEILKQDFKTGPEVTDACLSCHTEAARQVHKTIHWTWVCPKSIDPILGKSVVINNFCIALPSNESRCTSCHSGYGWRDSTFDFSSERNVDCLVCHDQTGTYEKFPTDAGHPAYEKKEFGGRIWYPPDLSYVAQNVGTPNRHNCGVCHFYGGGGEGVKHADLDETLERPTRDLDVHMDREGLNFSCIDCHTTKDHEISGRCYAVPAASERGAFPRTPDDKRITCESCHTKTPHRQAKINDHIDKVSCQACHIPYAAKKRYSKFWWDWSKAGKFDENGDMIVEKDEHGNITYHTMKGEFRWDKMTVPEYVWFNGSASNHLVTDLINDTTRPVRINRLLGDKDDPESRIWPTKVHRGKQVYDPINRTLIIPKLFGPKGSGAYWKDFDWIKSAQKGMDYIGLPFSGEVGFVETEMYWPITHMISPAEDALRCQDCHSREGRLAQLGGFYMPGRDAFEGLDFLGWGVVFLSVAGVLVHASLRVVFSRKNDDDDEPDESEVES